MRYLWSPWRLDYIISTTKHTSGCVFCNKIAVGKDEEELILVRGQYAFVAMNLYPYNNGHLLVIPYQHVPTLEALPSEALLEIAQLVNQSMATLRQVMNPDGFNVGVNIGREAGAGISAHVHVHVVPRWAADSNFISVIAQTRNIPETLPHTYKRLRAAWPGKPWAATHDPTTTGKL